MRPLCLLMMASALLLGQRTPLEAATITLDFDAIAVAPGNCASATTYLGSFGITFSPVSSGATGIICDVTNAGSSITPASGENVFFGVPPVTNTPVQYDLLFSNPLISLSFVRATVASNTSLPAWTATAFDASNAVLSSISQPVIFPGPSSALFTLSGPDITRVRFTANNTGGQTYNHPPIDNMTLTVNAQVPEPTTLLLVGSGLGFGYWRRRRLVSRTQ